MSEKSSAKQYILTAVVSAVLLAADQFTKIFVATRFSQGEGFSLIPGLLDFIYVRNPGVAFGMLENARWLFIPLTVAVIAAAFVYIIRKKPHGLLMWSLGLIISGGIGNLIDRVIRGDVVDFLQLKISWFEYIFNVADCCVVVGGALLILYLIIGMIKPEKALEQTDENPGA